MKTQTPTPRNGIAPRAAKQASSKASSAPPVATADDIPAEAERVLWDEVSSIPRDVQIRIALAAFTKQPMPAAVHEWLASMDEKVLLNLVGAITCEAKNPGRSGRDYMMEWVCARVAALPAEEVQAARGAEPKPPVLGWPVELDAAINQAAALNELLEHRILSDAGEGGYNDDIQCGLVELGAQTFNRLRAASQHAPATKGGAR